MIFVFDVNLFFWIFTLFNFCDYLKSIWSFCGCECKNTCCFMEDIGPMRLEGLLRHSCVVCIEEPIRSEGDLLLCGIDRNLTQLIIDVWMTNMEDLLVRMQCHIIGVPRTWVHLLKRVARIVLCYRDVHEDAPIDDYLFFMFHSFEYFWSHMMY